MQFLHFILLALLLLPSSAGAQARKPSTIAELVTYRGADREQLLYAGAKSEGKIVWYTSLAGDSYKELVKAFETKYAGVKVESYRAQRRGFGRAPGRGRQSAAQHRRRHRNHRGQPDLLARRQTAPPLRLAAARPLSGRRQGTSRQKPRLLGAGARIVHRLHLQQDARAQRTRCRKISTGCSTRSSRANWASASARPATRSSAP